MNSEPNGDSGRSSAGVGNHLLADCPPTIQHKWITKDLTTHAFASKPEARKFIEAQTPTAIFNAFFTDEVLSQVHRG